MIQDLEIENFMSFRTTATLSFEPARDDAQGVIIMPDGVRLLRFALLLGANASGKSNLLAAFDFLRHFLVNVPQSNNAPTGVLPFLLDDTSASRPTRFRLRFYAGSDKFVYSLLLTNNQVENETLQLCSPLPVTLAAKTIENGKSTVTFNNDLVPLSNTELEQINVLCWKNMSIFAALGLVNVSLGSIAPAFTFLRSLLRPVTPTVNLHRFCLSLLKQDSDFKAYLLDFAHKADFNINNISIRNSEITLSERDIQALVDNDNIDPKTKSGIIASGKFPTFDSEYSVSIATPSGSRSFSLPSSLQSAGTRRMVELEAVIYTAINAETLLVVDELETSIHPALLDFILEKFLSADSHAQMLASSHYDPLLERINDLFPEDSVWFTSKSPDGNSELYSLADFPDRRSLPSIHNAYTNGRFGAVPDIF